MVDGSVFKFSDKAACTHCCPVHVSQPTTKRLLTYQLTHLRTLFADIELEQEYPSRAAKAASMDARICGDSITFANNWVRTYRRPSAKQLGKCDNMVMTTSIGWHFCTGIDESRLQPCHPTCVKKGRPYIHTYSH